MLDGAPGALGAGVREDTTGRINGGLAFFSTAGTNYLRRWISRIEPQLHMDQDHEPFQFGRIALGIGPLFWLRLARQATRFNWLSEQ